jgi:NAD(P)-dependent dehydrogenase (short-subunit alcohol dehydrogenase family)
VTGRPCTGLVALVTGASKGGTGTAIALRLAAAGARVAVTARSQNGLERTARAIAAAGGEAIALTCDLADPADRECLVARAEARLGPIDILVNNAAAGAYKPFADWALAELEAMQQVNVWAPWMLAQQVLPGMRERGRGWILNLTSSVAELPPGPPFAHTAPARSGSAYGATKAALNRMTLALAAETQGQGITVNALTPQAAILTPELTRLRDTGSIDPDFFEPLETMAEAALILCTTRDARLHGRIAYSLRLLLELDHPTRDLGGKALLEGWQPDDLPAHLARQLAAHGRAEAVHDTGQLGAALAAGREGND